jgi:hypothetical protein
MTSGDFDNAGDLLSIVRGVAHNLSELHFGESADELVAWSKGTWTTGTEFLGELGVLCRQVIERDGERLPPCLREDLERCLKACRQAIANSTF